MHNYFKREVIFQDLQYKSKIWDLIIIGGGATGLGTALDAASRGYKTLLLEQSDFAKGSSSRATKLVHGGVRYLARGDFGMVSEALRERGLLMKNAPHLVRDISFIIPNYSWWEGIFYTLGLKLYNLMAGSLGIGETRHISRSETLKRLPNLNAKDVCGGVVYHDGQFDDSRLAINLAQTAMEEGATVVNYMKVTKILKNGMGQIYGVEATDIETGDLFAINARVVVNATGIFVDEILKMDTPEKRPTIIPSQGVHLVLDRSFMPTVDALMIPKTDDGRVIFVVPWHDRILVGTTDTAVDSYSLEPVALDSEISFLLNTVGKYFLHAPKRSDVLSVFAGLRPLAAPQRNSVRTKEISRGHRIVVSPSGLLSIIGGKWTTYRKMAEDTVNRAIEVGRLEFFPCVTERLPVHGSTAGSDWENPFFIYGSDLKSLMEMMGENPEWREQVHPDFHYLKGEVVWSVRFEMARCVEDVLARRTRVLFLDAWTALKMAPEVARLIAIELGRDKEWQLCQLNAFEKTARNYICKS